MTLQDFEMNAAGTQVLRCPTGEAPIEHRDGGRSKLVRLAIFGVASCADCPLRGQCPTQSRGDERQLRFTPAEAAVARRRIEQETPAVSVKVVAAFS